MRVGGACRGCRDGDLGIWEEGISFGEACLGRGGGRNVDGIRGGEVRNGGRGGDEAGISVSEGLYVVTGELPVDLYVGVPGVVSGDEDGGVMVIRGVFGGMVVLCGMNSGRREGAVGGCCLEWRREWIHLTEGEAGIEGMEGDLSMPLLDCVSPGVFVEYPLPRCCVGDADVPEGVVKPAFFFLGIEDLFEDEGVLGGSVIFRQLYWPRRPDGK